MEQLQATADVSALTARIQALLGANRPAAARQLLSAVRRLAPPSPVIAELAARVAAREGRPQLALDELDDAVAQFPDHAGLRRFRADLRLPDRRHDGSTGGCGGGGRSSIASTRRQRRCSASCSWNIAGRRRAGLPRRGRGGRSRQSRVIVRDWPRRRKRTATPTPPWPPLTAGIASAPRWVELRNAAILLCVRRRDFTAALRLAEEARVAGIADACSFGLMGHALSSLGRHAEAADAYAEALKLGPEDPYVRHLVAAAGILPSAPRAPVEYLRAVFDGYAERFEAHLISLGYRIPGLIRAVLARHPVIAAGGCLGPALDLGCGTGFVAVALSDLQVAPLVGVDVSPRMLEAAAEKQRYAELHEADLMSFLAEDERRWRLILAADVLIYFGALTELLTIAHARLEPGGWFVLSLEELLPGAAGSVPDNGDWALQCQGRYAHSMDYVAASARNAGFAIRTLERQTVRFEGEAPVAGFLVVLERGAA